MWTGRRTVGPMTDRLLSLAAGTILDVGPAAAVEVAAAAGFPAVGSWFDPATWTDATGRAVAAALAATGLVALDIEPVILGRGDDHGERIIEAARAVGARHVLVASGPAPRAEVVDRLGELAAAAASAAPGLVLVLEFLPIFTVGDLRAAVDVVSELAAPNVGVLVDTLHLDRSGGTAGELAGVDPALLPYLQLADAPAARPGDAVALRDEALHGRLLPGDGSLPLRDVLAAVPGVPVSVELRSRALTERYPDPVERARAVRRACDRVMP
jgi:sugar phosphate isomerase/epimerase